MNDDQNTYTFVLTYGYGYTAFHHHMISVVVFFYSNTLKIMLVDYVVIEMGIFDDYSYAVPRVKTMRGDFITTFLFQVDQCISFYQK